MFDFCNISHTLASLPVITNAVTRSISPENPTGQKGNGCKAIPEPGSPASDLGRNWKVRPCITLKGSMTTTIADITGPGVINHIWLTVDTKAYRDCVIRFYWDSEETPSIEVPLGDFFACCHGKRHKVNSLPVAVNPSGGFNCYWQMPFKNRAKIMIENQCNEDIEQMFYQIIYSLTDVPNNIGYMHVQWRRSMTRRDKPEHIILDNVEGEGHYVGTVISWTQLSDGWWGEGEVKFYIDEDGDFPTICSTGTEDYFGGAWCFGETYSNPFSGYPLCQTIEGKIPKHGLYRWHIMDSINFKKDIKVTIQALGWWPNKKFQPLTDDISSVAYWYQKEPHVMFPELPNRQKRWPRG